MEPRRELSGIAHPDDNHEPGSRGFLQTTTVFDMLGVAAAACLAGRTAARHASLRLRSHPSARFRVGPTTISRTAARMGPGARQATAAA